MVATLCWWNDKTTRSLSLYSKNWAIYFPLKRGQNFSICLDAVGIMLRHDAVPVVEYQTRTVELTSLLEACPTLLPAAMHRV